MQFQFPEGFIWGTSTAAAQIETAFDHQWKGVKSKDGYVFEETIAHERMRDTDVGFISQFGSMYRCGVDWSRLQRSAFQPFDLEVVEEYQLFFRALKERGMDIMFVIHHFTNPTWFEEKGHWLTEDCFSIYLDFARQCVEYFGEYVSNWNTFNEPNVYALNSQFTGDFPPFKKNRLDLANRVLKNMGRAHGLAYEFIKHRYPDHPIGISYNTGWFDSIHPLGVLPAKFVDWWFNDFGATFFKEVDYWGVSYYAYIPFAPGPITEIDNPGELAKRGIPNDMMWGYRPEGPLRTLRRFHNKYKLPIIITENGVCSGDPKVRIQALRDYLGLCHQAILEGIDLKGYIHWSTFDNFEWHLGPTYQFGLVEVNMQTMERTMTEAGQFYAQIARDNGF